MPSKRHNIRFPSIDTNDLSQDEAYFTLTDSDGEETKIRFHDYDTIYDHQGLYEQLFYDRLKCHSPEKVVSILRHGMAGDALLFNELRVLDLGAGNGMVGAELQKTGVSRLVGVDISAPAEVAVWRDRPGVYDDYHAIDMSAMTDVQHEYLESWRFNCLITVAALGFGDIPVRVFSEAFNLVEDGGWIAFNIKETFLADRDTSGFSVFIKTLILSEYLDIYHMERYRHRLSIDGQPLYYFAVACRKLSGIPPEFIDAIGD
jgi:predicted TPR repeat methyltransferase